MPRPRLFTHEYFYRDEHGVIQYNVCRSKDGRFPVRVPDQSNSGGYRWGYNGVSRIPYHLDQIVKAAADEPIFIVEGEKDADSLAHKHLVATTNPGGPLQWSDSETFSQNFTG